MGSPTEITFQASATPITPLGLSALKMRKGEVSIPMPSRGTLSFQDCDRSRSAYLSNIGAAFMDFHQRILGRCPIKVAGAASKRASEGL
jgi:hypothetical protein